MMEQAGEEGEAWRNIKPSQNLDALNRQEYKKRKYEEYRERKAKYEAQGRGRSRGRGRGRG